MTSRWATRQGHPEIMTFYDAHNHLHDERLAPHRTAVLNDCARAGIVKMVVNGACEADWPEVLALARECPERVVASFGYHPWYVRERTGDWQKHLVGALDQVPSAIGEIGLDRWKEGFDPVAQEEVFVWQLRLAAERGLPASIHCLNAWGWLFDLLRKEPRPQCGFLLHSFGGPQEMIEPLARLGAYFSFPGYYLHERKVRQRETFRHVPLERLLVESDAPDQMPPPECVRHPLPDADGKPVNHPANLPAIYEGLAELRGEPVEMLAARVEENFRRLFAPVLQRAAAGTEGLPSSASLR